MPEASDHPSAVSGALHRPSSEQLAFFRRKLKNLVPTERWDDLIGAEHDNAFMVAGAAKADLLTDLAAAVDKAIAEGRGLEEFRRDFRAIVKRHGWTGWAGEGSVRGEAWRVRTILSTNSYTSYAAGRMAQLREGGFKYWVYRHGGSREPRIVHLSWDGIALPPDHEFWKTHYPPSDWGCSCYVVGARTAAGVKRLGGDPDKTLPANWNRIDPRTGAPVGIGKHWNYAPGASVSDEVMAMARKIGSWDHRIAKGFMEDVPASRRDALADAYRALPSTADDARRYAQRVFDGTAKGAEDLAPIAPQRTLGLVRSDQADEIRKMVDQDVTGFDFSLDRSGIGHAKNYHGDPLTEWKSGQRAVTPPDFATIPEVVRRAPLVKLEELSDQGEIMFEQRLTIDGDTYVARWALRGTKRRTLALKTFFIRVRERGPKPTS